MKATALLAGDWASRITGASLTVDGGLLLPVGGMPYEKGLGNQEQDERVEGPMDKDFRGAAGVYRNGTHCANMQLRSHS